MLVVAQSGRMLAVQLAAEGQQVLVIDCFADEDMQAVAKDFRLVADLSLPSVKPAFEQLAGRYGFSAVIYGSGLERYGETLAFLQRHARLLGNPVEVVRALQQTKDLFERLDRFAIAHPPVQFSPPSMAENWLFKPDRGEGGIGVRWAKETDFAGRTGYWQQFVDGRPMSALFLANGKQAQIVGVHQQLTECRDGQPFLFAGVVTVADFSAAHRRQIQRWLDRLVGDYGLVGLNSLDFVLADNEIRFLEINARPSASLQLYPARLVSAHIAACLGKNQEVRYNSKICGGYKIVFARRAWQIPERFCWPEWVSDRPLAGTMIEAGQPLCSLSCVGVEPIQVFSELAVKERQLIDLF